MMHWMRSAPKPKVAAEANARRLVDKLKANKYQNEQYRESDKRMLVHYLGVRNA
jgi:hypothetical protein